MKLSYMCERLIKEYPFLSDTFNEIALFGADLDIKKRVITKEFLSKKVVDIWEVEGVSVFIVANIEDMLRKAPVIHVYGYATGTVLDFVVSVIDPNKRYKFSTNIQQLHSLYTVDDGVRTDGECIVVIYEFDNEVRTLIKDMIAEEECKAEEFQIETIVK